MKNRKNLILWVSLATLLTIFLPMQVKATTEEEYPYAYVYMQKGTLNVRAEPSTSATITEKLHIGDVVEKRTITKDGWSKVITSTGKEGYVFDKYLKPATKDWRKYKIVSAEVAISKSNANRDYNIAKAAGVIDGLILKPGEKFDWFDVVGDANKEKGYKLATMYKNRKSVLAYGGGVCQVCITLYNAINDLGIVPTEKKEHSKSPGYVREDMVDTTIAYPTKNFAFVNTCDFTITFETFAEKGESVVLAYEVLE